MNHSTTLRSPLSEEGDSRNGTAFQVVGLHTLENSLATVRANAALLEEPVIAYFIDMAIAEVKRKSRLRQGRSRRKRDYEMKSLMQLMD